MKSKKQFFSREIIVNNMTRFWWISVLFTIALFLFSSMPTLMPRYRFGDDFTIRGTFENIFISTLIFLFSVPVFVGTMVFRYIQNKKSVVLLHSMPYTRLRLYVNNVISGLILILVPILLNTAFLSAIQLSGTIFEEGAILKYLWVSALISTTLYIWTIFVGMFTGSSIAQIIFTYISNVLIFGIVSAIATLLRSVIYGFCFEYSELENFIRLSPIFQAIEFSAATDMDIKLNVPQIIIIDAIICILGLILGYVVYRNRNLETAGDVISIKFMKPVFKYGVTMCVMLIGVLYVATLFSLNNVNILIYIIFALIGYVIAEMLIKKSLKVWKSYKGFLAYLLVFMIIAFGISQDLFGYEKYIPKKEDISAIEINFFIDNVGYSDGTISSNENVERVLQLHKNIIEDKNENLTDSEAFNNVSIAYQLVNGKKVCREYSIDSSKYVELLCEIYNTEEYKKASNELFSYKLDDISEIRIMYFDKNYDEDIVVTERNKISELLEAAKKDILENSSNQTLEKEDILLVQFYLKSKNLDSKRSNYFDSGYGFNENSKNVLEFMRKYGYSI